MGIAMMFGATSPAPVGPTLGANISAIADFRSSLSASIDPDATEMTITTFVSGQDSLVIGETYGFKIGGREYVLGTASTSNKIVNMTRGLSRRTATTTYATYAEQWGRGTAVEITDAPLILDLANKANGITPYTSPLKYSGVSTTTLGLNDDNISSVGYAKSLAFGGVPSASETAAGYVELATQIEAASSTSLGSTGSRVILPATISTSTYNAATAVLRVVMTKNNGKIDDNFISTSTLLTNAILNGSSTVSGNLTITGTSNIASSSIITFTSSTSPSTTWTKPANLKYIRIEVVAAGGSGITDARGGGAGGYCRKIIPAVALGATETVIVGGAAGGGPETAGNRGGPSSFGSFCSTTGGRSGNATGGQSAVGGTATGGDVNIPGENGANGDASENISGQGGVSALGYIGSGGTGGGANHDGIVIVEQIFN